MNRFFCDEDGDVVLDAPARPGDIVEVHRSHHSCFVRIMARLGYNRYRVEVLHSQLDRVVANTVDCMQISGPRPIIPDRSVFYFVR